MPSSDDEWAGSEAGRGGPSPTCAARRPTSEVGTTGTRAPAKTKKKGGRGGRARKSGAFSLLSENEALEPESGSPTATPASSARLPAPDRPGSGGSSTCASCRLLLLFAVAAALVLVFGSAWVGPSAALRHIIDIIDRARPARPKDMTVGGTGRASTAP